MFIFHILVIIPVISTVSSLNSSKNYFDKIKDIMSCGTDATNQGFSSLVEENQLFVSMCQTTINICIGCLSCFGFELLVFIIGEIAYTKNKKDCENNLLQRKDEISDKETKNKVNKKGAKYLPKKYKGNRIKNNNVEDVNYYPEATYQLKKDSSEFEAPVPQGY